MLRRRGFPEEWIRWVKLCVTTSTFAVLVDGRPQGGWIHPQHGIRQGCPLAPLIFILAADTLARCAVQLCEGGLLRGFQTPGWPGGIPLLQYADDTTFFIEGAAAEAENLSAAEAENLSILLDIFSDFSGLSLKRAKSTLVGIGLPPEELSRCSQILATPIGSLPLRYLGLPLPHGRL